MLNGAPLAPDAGFLRTCRHLLLAFWAACALVCATMAAPARDIQTLVFFGDSLTAGYGLDNPTSEAYPALIQQKIDAEHLPWRVINAGVSGETTAGGLRRIDWILRQRVDVFVLALGANDGLRGIDPAVTAENLKETVDRVRAKYPNAKIVIAGMQMPQAMGNEFSTKYRNIFPGVAKNENAILLPFLLEGIAGKPDLNQSDGIHPTAAGQRILADNVWKVIRPLL